MTTPWFLSLRPHDGPGNSGGGEIGSLGPTYSLQPEAGQLGGRGQAVLALANVII